jgi:sarcosine oxidase subunit alpha
MTGPFRTPSGGRVDRSQAVRFSFDGVSYVGCKGDTLASGLLANGVHLIGRSFKYHRPRGLLASGSEEPNGLVNVARDQARQTPNLRATQVELYEGLTAVSQNRWPSLSFDVGEINNSLSPLLPAGFYYKTFMGPRFVPKAWSWTHVFEPAIRQAAGLGVAPREADPDRYANRFEHCDVLVVGAGPAGLMAALAAVECGAKVIICDEQSELGGSFLQETSADIDGRPARDWALDIILMLAMQERLRILPRTTAFGYFAQNFVALCERLTDHRPDPSPDMPRERLWQIRAKEVVLATGAIERPLVFPDNDRPGIMLAGAARTYLNRYGVKAGSRALVATSTGEGYGAALDLQAAGVEIAAIIDARPSGGAAQAAAEAAGIRVETAAGIIATRGRLRLTQAEIVTSDRPSGRGEWVYCDLLLMSGGWTPSVHLFSQSRGKLAYDEVLQAFVPGQSAQRERSAGACRGTFDFEAVLNEGYAAGCAAAEAAGLRASGAKTFSARARFEDGAPEHTRPSPALIGGMAFVDFQNDVTAKDIALATREGFRSIEHIKRFTTTGMATDQGKTSNLNALALASQALGKSIAEIGVTSFRQPYTPVTFGTLAGLSRGDLFDPIRKTAIHDWAEEQGAKFEDVGLWKRAWYFPQSGETKHEAVKRESLKVRQSAGIFDASTLGKIEVVGPDAAKFLDLLYTNAWGKLEPGRCRYGIMLNEAGFIMDDGVIGRLAADRFHVTTTTGGAPRVLHHMEDYLQTEFGDLKVWLTSTTEQWAVIAVQGPNARRILAPLVEGVDLDSAAMPHMSVREASVAGVPARLFRVSFTGELGYEVNVPADFGRGVWEAIWMRAEALGAIAYGTETMHVLRAEKGYIIVGQDTDGTMTPDDMGLGWAIGKAKPDFVGKRSLARPDLVASGRKQFVGLSTLDPSEVLEEGSQIVERAGGRAIGHVTSAYWSETLQRSIALAMVADGRLRLDQTLYVPDAGRMTVVRLCDPVFFDREGKRLDT